MASVAHELQDRQNAETHHLAESTKTSGGKAKLLLRPQIEVMEDGLIRGVMHMQLRPLAPRSAYVKNSVQHECDAEFATSSSRVTLSSSLVCVNGAHNGITQC
jgi:hypothetical protein